MKLSPQRMTRVHWHLGQGLLPEHFYAQEESLRAESALRFEMLGLPAWGLADLEIDPGELAKGLLEVNALALVLESGVVISIPGNAPKVELDLGSVGGDRPAPIYLHLESDFDIVKSSPGDPGEEGIERILQKVRLSVDVGPSGRSFKLACVEQSAEGRWSFSSSYVPPLLGVRRGLLFDAPLDRMERIVSGLRDVLSRELLQNHLSGETQLLARQAMGKILHFSAMLTDIDAGLRLHPHQVFAALRGLYIDMAVLRGDSQLHRLATGYDHEDLAGVFNLFLEPLEAMATGGSSALPYIEMRLLDRKYSCELPADVRRAVDVFLLVQKPRAAARLALEGIKLASPNRIQIVHERSLSGIRFTSAGRPPFAQTLSSAVELFQLARGEEWDHAVKERRVVIEDDEALAGCRLYLYFRMG